MTVSSDTRGPDSMPAAAVGATNPAGDATEQEGWTDVPFADRMATVEFRISERPHIVVDSERCEGCSTQACVTACPANLFVPTAEGKILFNYEECFECGTCYMVCNVEGAISWSYPEGGFGVALRRG
jgi:ferredoxin like protein